MSLVELDQARSLVERTIGRPLRPAERHIDILRLDHALNRGKNQLERAIRAEMLRATRVWLRSGFQWRPRLELTAAMRAPLLNLHRIGRQEARRELGRTRIPVRAHAAANPDPHIGGLDAVWQAILRSLPGLAVRIQDDLVRTDLSEASAAAIARALLRIPGARDIASRVVSTALMSGMGQTFEEAGELVAGWEYTAVLDAAVCEECAPLDGEVYPTWEAIQVVLPNGGPNPLCLGGGRCRCRAVPLG